MGRNKKIGTEKKRERERKLRKPKLGPEHNEREKMSGGRRRDRREQGTRKDLEGPEVNRSSVRHILAFGKLFSVGSPSYPKGRCTVTSFWHP